MFKKNAGTNVVNLIESYRFISVFLTVAIYTASGLSKDYAAPAMLVLALCVIASAFLFNYLYKVSYNIRYRLYLLLLMEIIGISMLILLTEGLDSPFIWLFLNPLLIISFYMPGRQKTIYLATNFLLLCTMGYYRESTLGFGEYLLARSNIILSYLLILILVNILLDYNSRIKSKQEQLQAANNKLESYNKRIEGMIQDIISMYEAVQSIPGQREIREVVNIILDFAGRISQDAAAFFMFEDCNETDNLMSSQEIDENTRKELTEKIAVENGNMNDSAPAVCTLSENQTVVFARISNVRPFGTAGLLIPEREYTKAKNEFYAGLMLYSQLAVTFFEKIESDAVDRELVIADEQNRIADDIHDSVVQRLFAMSCFTYDMINKWDQLADGEKKAQVKTVMETIQSSLIDLRSTIYNLSDRKQQIDHLAESITAYLKDLEKLSGIKIDVRIKGNLDSLMTGAKKALYRIITECTGNAIRHAKCKNIRVDLQVEDSRTHLTIKDDGTGLDVEKARQEKNGLGLYNIRSLVRIFNGNIDIISGKGTGTTFDIDFASENITKKFES